jgi:hypothetical protein
MDTSYFDRERPGAGRRRERAIRRQYEARGGAARAHELRPDTDQSDADQHDTDRGTTT